MGTRNLRLVAVGAAAGALALGSVGTASASLLPTDPLSLTNTVGNVLGTVVPAVTAPIVGQGGLLDNTVIAADAKVVVPNVAYVDTKDAVVINDGKIIVATDTNANVANVVKADVEGVAAVNTQKPSVFVYVPEAHVNVAGIKVHAFVAPTKIDLRHLTVKAPLIAARVQVGHIKVKAKVSAFVNLKKGKVFVKAKAKAKIGHIVKIKARAKVKVKLHHGLKTKVFIRATAH